MDPKTERIKKLLAVWFLTLIVGLALGAYWRSAEGSRTMVEDWCEIIVVKPTNDGDDNDIQRGAGGLVYINCMEVKSVSRFVASDIISSVQGYPMCPPTMRSSGNS